MNRKKFIALVLFVALQQMGLAQPVNKLKKKITASEGRSLLLLGTYDLDKGYQTIVVFNEKGRSRVVSKLPYLLSPQKNGYLYIQQRNFSNNLIDRAAKENESITINKIYFSLSKKGLQDSLLKKAPQPKKGTCKDCKERSETWSRNSISYIIPGFITFKHSGGGHAGGPYSSSTTTYTKKINSNKNFVIQSGSLLESGFSSGLPSSDHFSFKQDIKDWHLVLTALSYIDQMSAYNCTTSEHEDSIPYELLKNYSDPTYLQSIERRPIDYRPNLLDISYAIDHYVGETRLFVRGNEWRSESQFYEVEAGPLSKKYVYNYFPGSPTLKEHLRQTGDDVFASPARDVIYYLENKYNENNCETKFLLKDIRGNWKYKIEGDIIMAEWAIGSKVDEWLTILNKQ